MTIHSSRDLFGERPNAFYDVLAHLEPGLMLDVGAAAGAVTMKLLDRSPNSTVLAFEPFPGNHPYLEHNIGNDERVTIIKAAVADTTEPASLFVPATVTGTERGWEDYIGYSSAGRLVDDADECTITVPTVRIDDVVGDRPVRFMKVDVQGGELGVLHSAARCLVDDRMDLMFIEFSGEQPVLDCILGAGFEVFDSKYLLVPRGPQPKQRLSAWHVFRQGNLSSGSRFWLGWPHDMPAEPRAYCAMFTEHRATIGVVQTDLVCVRSDTVDDYLAAAAKAAG